MYWIFAVFLVHLILLFHASEIERKTDTEMKTERKQSLESIFFSFFICFLIFYQLLTVAMHILCERVLSAFIFQCVVYM